uniref:Uncharacterized protein n=1 Tax=Chromera velia CCMP2878 TaxID=1169474 RepID=A0A0G4F241_9ALVE|eukprot:Cvel_14809.t1-p1 / transcript=Cvel_14809.t1 / gene=Cvel_14809 / organism=Chromera_velia_CCMP2878 / gene_product=hypothetical protein / transcript_product=hypothetical protein / location=Cvel_scaffold1068:39198-39539(-) / protein_length=114 / sequence_SO=supercontig / SO=protein_coding / is_pseudo=false
MQSKYDLCTHEADVLQIEQSTGSTQPTRAFLRRGHASVPRRDLNTPTVTTMCRALLGVAFFSGGISRKGDDTEYEGNATVVRTSAGRVLALTSLHTFQQDKTVWISESSVYSGN